MSFIGYPLNQQEQIFPILQTAQYPYFSNFNTPIIQETPETILARINPKRTLKLLEDISVKNYKSRINEIGASVINTYLNRLTSEDAVGLRECEFQEVERRNIFGVVTEKGMRFTFIR